MKINEILLWAGPDQFPKIFYDFLHKNQLDSGLGWPDQFPKIFYKNVNENQADSALGWPRPISIDFILKFK